MTVVIPDRQDSETIHCENILVFRVDGPCIAHAFFSVSISETGSCIARKITKILRSFDF